MLLLLHRMAKFRKNIKNILKIIILAYLVNCALQIGYGYECYDELGDVNYDSVINILDVVILINTILNP